MKQKLKNGYEYDLTSKWRKKGILSPPRGGWKSIKKILNRRFRKETVYIKEWNEDVNNCSNAYMSKHVNE